MSEVCLLKIVFFVDEIMIRILFVVDILRVYADSKKFWRQSNLVHWEYLLLTS